MPLMIGHSIMGSALTCTGAPAESRKHYDQAIALYNPADHRPLATRRETFFNFSFSSPLTVTFFAGGCERSILAGIVEPPMDVARRLASSRATIRSRSICSSSKVLAEPFSLPPFSFCPNLFLHQDEALARSHQPAPAARWLPTGDVAEQGKRSGPPALRSVEGKNAYSRYCQF